MSDNTRVVLVPSRDWASTASRFADHNYQQLEPYAAATARRSKSTYELVAVEDGRDVLAAAHVRLRRMPGASFGIAYCGAGPLYRCGEPEDLERLQVALIALRRHYVVDRGCVLRLLMPVGRPDMLPVVRRLFEAVGLQDSPVGRTYRTMRLQLDPDAAVLRAKLAQKWRNGLNNAERQGLEVVTGTSSEMFQRFNELFESFRARKPFAVDLPPRFFLGLQPLLSAEEKFTVTLALREGQPVAGHVGSSLGDTCVYLFGATDEEGLRTKAAYLLQWHALLAAKRRGMQYYDLGGIDVVANPGVHHFKAGLRGEEVSAPGPVQSAPGNIRGRVVLGAEAALLGLRSLATRGLSS